MKVRLNLYFASKRKIKRVTKLNYRNIQITQHSKVTYLDCILDETMSGESMALNVINKINSRLKFRHNLLCIVSLVSQPHSKNEKQNSSHTK